MKSENIIDAENTKKSWIDNLRRRGWSEEDLKWMEEEFDRNLQNKVKKEVKDWN